MNPYRMKYISYDMRKYTMSPIQNPIHCEHLNNLPRNLFLEHINSLTPLNRNELVIIIVNPKVDNIKIKKSNII